MHLNSAHTYDVPLVSSDLRKEECILQIADALEYLDKVASDVFSRISSKVSDNKKRLQTVNDRINLAQAKIEKIKGTSKATKIFSSPKYPAVDDIERYQSLFNEVGPGLNEIKRNHHQIRSKFVEVDENILREKLQYYNVTINRKKNKQEAEAEGLGRLPDNINSISSLLLFNTTENPYKKYVMFDPLGVVTKVRKEEEEDDGLTAAPVSILQGEEMERLEGKSLKYRPELGEVPDISLPEYLPELLGVADDMTFSADIGGSSIAPSVPSTLPDLPSITPEVDVIPAGPASTGSGPPAPPAAAPPPPPPAAPPAAPPPPPPVAPAAPPPPPMAPAAPQPAKESGEVKKQKVDDDDDGGGRSGLLDAIRKAGGVGALGKKKNKRPEKRKEPPPAAGGGDLLSDLKNRLTGRRKGISGTKSAPSVAVADQGAEGASGAIEAMKSFIPPPPARPAAHSDAANDDEDWE